MPGVNVTTATRSGPQLAGRAPSSTFFVSGLTERGRVDRAYEVNSMAQYEREFGTRVSFGTIYDTLRTFFEEGGVRAYVVRVVGAAATIGTLTLSDGAGTPLPTLRFDAKGAGAWSAGLSVQVATGTVPDTFKVLVTYGDDVESYDNLASPAAAVTAINRRSRWVVVTNLGSATAAPDNNPAVTAATALTAGTDDRASVVSGDYVTALDARAPADLGDGLVAIPGQLASVVGLAVLDHVVATNRLAALALGQAATSADAVDAASQLRGLAGSEHVGLFYPWLKVPDGAGGTRDVSPEGFVAAARTRAHLETGPERAPGGAISQASYVVDVTSVVGRVAGDSLDNAGVSVIRPIPGGGIRLYGWRSLSDDIDNYALLTGRDMLNYLEVEGERRLEQFVFRTVDARGHLFSDIAAELIGLVEPIRVRGGLYELFSGDGAQVDPGYAVNTSETVNTPQRLALNEVNAELGVRVSPTGAIINLLITKAGLTASL